MSRLSGRTTGQKHHGSLPSQISELKNTRTLATPRLNHLVDPVFVLELKFHEQLRRVLTWHKKQQSNTCGCVFATRT